MTLRSALAVALLIFLDQITKLLVSAKIGLNESIPIIKGMLHITRIHNTGIAFGLFKGMVFVFIFISFAAVFLIVLCASRFHSGYTYLRMGLLLILAGTLGNLIDRIRMGYVLDFIDMQVWPVFNVADITITMGAVLMAYQILKMQS